MALKRREELCAVAGTFGVVFGSSRTANPTGNATGCPLRNNVTGGGALLSPRTMPGVAMFERAKKVLGRSWLAVRILFRHDFPARWWVGAVRPYRDAVRKSRRPFRSVSSPGLRDTSHLRIRLLSSLLLVIFGGRSKCFGTAVRRQTVPSRTLLSAERRACITQNREIIVENLP